MATLLGRGNCIEEFPSLNPTIITSCLFYVLHKKFNSSAELTKSHLFCLPPVDILRLQVVVFIFISYLRAMKSPQGVESSYYYYHYHLL